MGILISKLGKSSLTQKQVLFEWASWGIVFSIFLITPLPTWIGFALSQLVRPVGSVQTLLGVTSVLLVLALLATLRCWFELGRRTCLAETDPLTGLYNRRYLRGVLATELARIKRHPRPLSLIMFDIDNFKRINDSLGHPAGDDVLKGLAELVRKYLREQDCLARWGGDEFVIVTPETDLLGSFQLAERLRNQFGKQSFGSAGKVTASFGVSRVEYQDDVDSFLSRVDRLLFLAKERGKNVVQTEPINLVARASASRRSQLLA